MKNNLLMLIFTLLTLYLSIGLKAEKRPNILLIIADDMGVDALKGYDVGTILPNTPNIDKLRESGVTFTNTWACPACTPTRASMLTGKYGVNSGVNTVPGILGSNQKSIFKELDELTDNAYANCVVGKWHISRPINIDHPYDHGADDFMGIMKYGVEDYSNWTKVENHASSTCTEYVTRYFTDYASNWINQQKKPWLMWLAHVAPHTPFHVPPSKMYTSKNVNTNFQKFITMIETLDYEVGRLLDSIPQNVLDNTVILFIGDNGTPGNLIQGFPLKRGKNTIYQGGINVPLIVSGYGVTRKNETEDALINACDIYATIAQIAQTDAYPTNKVNDSHSFKQLLKCSNGFKRNYNYMEMGANKNTSTDIYAIRDSIYKIIYDIDGNKEMFNLSIDPFETNNLLSSDLNTEELAIKLDLEQKMFDINGISFADDTTDDSTSRNDGIVTPSNSYTIVGTGVTNSYNNTGVISLPDPGDSFFGQNSNHIGNAPSYTDNNDGTVSDNVTGLMWEQTTDKNGDGDINYYDKEYYEDALAGAASCTTGGYTDWRLPTIKEQYSLIMYYGAEPNPMATSQGTAVPYINTDYFAFGYGDMNARAHGARSDERIIDAQYATSTIYVSTTMDGNSTIFGVNFGDGRIKGYPATGRKKFYVQYVRGNTDYGMNIFVDNNDGTVTDNATGLMWMQNDDGAGMLWEEALSYAENFTHAGFSDWRLPDVKELQSIVDYTRSPATTSSAAINPLFNCTEIINEAGETDYPFYTNSTTFSSQTPTKGTQACYISFGRAMGYMSNFGGWIDVHGAGAQRSDPKTGDPANYPNGFGPQGDAIRINNFVRLVRKTENETVINKIENEYQLKIYPNPTANSITIDNDRFINNISIYTIHGLKIINVNPRVKAKSVKLNTSELNNGIYILSITDDLTNKHIKKILIG